MRKCIVLRMRSVDDWKGRREIWKSDSRWLVNGCVNRCWGRTG